MEHEIFHVMVTTDLIPRFIIRADSSRDIGTGHIVRCLALAEECKTTGGDVTFISYCESDSLVNQIHAAGCEFIPLTHMSPHPLDLQTTFSIIEKSAGSKYRRPWIILDGYQFDVEYHQEIRRTGCHLLVIDDRAHLQYYNTDVLLNQNLGADQVDYVCDTDTTLLLGSKYALLRSQFLQKRIQPKNIPRTVTKVLVTMGGADPHNVTSKVIHAIQNTTTSELEILAVVGASNPHLINVQQAAKSAQLQVDVVHDTDEMPKFISWADIAISAAGSTAWELALMGTPMILVVTADNQLDIADQMSKARAAYTIESRPTLNEEELRSKVNTLISDPNERKRMSEQSQNIVDGHGSERVVNELNLAVIDSNSIQGS